MGPINPIRVSCPLCCTKVNMLHLDSFFSMMFCLYIVVILTELLYFVDMNLFISRLTMIVIDEKYLRVHVCIVAAIKYFEFNWIELKIGQNICSPQCQWGSIREYRSTQSQVSYGRCRYFHSKTIQGKIVCISEVYDICVLAFARG